MTRLVVTELPPNPPPEMPSSDVFRVYPMSLGLTPGGPAFLTGASGPGASSALDCKNLEVVKVAVRPERNRPQNRPLSLVGFPVQKRTRYGHIKIALRDCIL